MRRAYGLIDPGIADLSRLCIVGWSYGGHAALIGVVKEPQLYRAQPVAPGHVRLNLYARLEAFLAANLAPR